MEWTKFATEWHDSTSVKVVLNTRNKVTSPRARFEALAVAESHKTFLFNPQQSQNIWEALDYCNEFQGLIALAGTSFRDQYNWTALVKLHVFLSVFYERFAVKVLYSMAWYVWQRCSASNEPWRAYKPSFLCLLYLKFHINRQSLLLYLWLCF
jgi:hypothetical protein